MATVTKIFEKGPDTRTISGPALDMVIEEVLRPVTPLMRKLMTRHLDRAIAAVRGVFASIEPFQKRDPYLALVSGAVKCIDRAENRVQEIETHLGIQEAALRFASNALEREAIYIETCRFLRRTPQQLRGDRKAFRRFMDWEAIVELARRAERGARRYQQTLVFLAARALARCGPDRGRTAADVMERTGFTEIFGRAIQQRLPVHLEREWIDAVVAILRAHKNPKKGIVLDPSILHALAVRAQNPWADVWVQCGALYAWLLASPNDALRLARQRLRSPDPKNRDDIFVRRFLVEKAKEVLDENGAFELIQSAMIGPDPSPHVRQGAVLAMGDGDPEKSWPILREHVLMREDWDPCPEVRAAVNLVLAKWAVLPRGADIALQEWRLFFEREFEGMPLVLAMKHAGNALEHLVGFGQLDPKVAEQFALELVEKAVAKGWSLPVRTSCEDLLERVRVAALPGFSAFRDQVVPVLFESNREDQVDVVVDDPAVNDEIIGRFLAWLSRRHYGLYALKRAAGGWRVTVGHQKRWRLWRWIHETLNPAPDKRQAISHVRGRRYEGTIRCHPLGLGEESPTKVPGEPIQMTAEGGWRRFLPLPDDFLDSLELGTVQTFSSEGIVTIEPPKGTKPLWKLRWRMAREYAALAALREQARNGNPEAPPNAYVERLRSMGFKVTFRPHPPADLSLALIYFVEAAPGHAEAPDAQRGSVAVPPAETGLTPRPVAPEQPTPAPALDGWTAPPPEPEDAVAGLAGEMAKRDPLDELTSDAPLLLPPTEPSPEPLALRGDVASEAGSALDAWDDAPKPPKDPLDELTEPPALPEAPGEEPPSLPEAPASDPLADWDKPALPAAEEPKVEEPPAPLPPNDPFANWDDPPALPPSETPPEVPRERSDSRDEGPERAKRVEGQSTDEGDKGFIIPPPAPPAKEGEDFLT